MSQVKRTRSTQGDLISSFIGVSASEGQGGVVDPGTWRIKQHRHSNGIIQRDTRIIIHFSRKGVIAPTDSNFFHVQKCITDIGNLKNLRTGKTDTGW